MASDWRRVRSDFPITRRRIRTADGKLRPLIFLDHGASTHAPQPVLDEVATFCSTRYANVHRAHHTLSQEASADFEAACETMGRFVGADPETQPVVLGHNTTQVLDLAAHLLAGRRGTTLTTLAEHHSNDLPHRRRGKTLHAEVDGEGRLLLDSLEQQLQKNRVKLLTVTGASNVTGLMPPIHKLARLAHDNGALILVDAAQLLAHAPIDAKPMDHPEHLDLIAGAGHKAYAPFGSAFLAAPSNLLDEAPPYMPGGGTVRWVTRHDVAFKGGPERHMAGTPNIVGAIAFAAALRYLDRIGMDAVRDHEEELVRLALRRFAELEEAGVRLLGPTGEQAAPHKVGVFAFTMRGATHGDVSVRLDREHAIATRNGCFCAQPLLNHLLELGETPAWTKAADRGQNVEIPGATRATLGLYNTAAEVEAFADALRAMASSRT
ncbi:MAG: aminotransferase class V-fold PLP-dependent enzyme [Candidatus Thermoplasmatota archaeon]